MKEGAFHDERIEQKCDVERFRKVEDIDGMKVSVLGARRVELPVVVPRAKIGETTIGIDFNSVERGCKPKLTKFLLMHGCEEERAATDVGDDETLPFAQRFDRGLPIEKGEKLFKLRLVRCVALFGVLHIDGSTPTKARAQKEIDAVTNVTEHGGGARFLRLLQGNEPVREFPQKSPRKQPKPITCKRTESLGNQGVLGRVGSLSRGT